MELLLALALLGGQTDPLVAADDKRVEKWKKVLEKLPDDPEACLQVGRNLCFLHADWDAGLPLLAKCKDATMAEFAQRELGTLDLLPVTLTGATIEFGEQVAPDLVRGDALWEMMKKYRDAELRNIMNRAIFRYRLALSKVDETKKKKLMEKVSKVMDRFRAMYTHPGKVYEGAPKGWGVVVGKGEKVEGIATDESRSKNGRASLRITPAKAGLIVTDRISIFPGEYTLSFWYLAEGTVAPDPVAVWLFDKAEGCHPFRAKMPPDKGELPIFQYVEMKVKADSDILFFRLYIDNTTMREGTIWIDDISFKSQKGEELIKNGGFEER